MRRAAGTARTLVREFGPEGRWMWPPRSRGLDHLGPAAWDLVARMMVAGDAGRQLLKLDEAVGLAAEIVGDHRRRRADRRYDRHAHTAPLHRLNQPAEIAIAGEQDCVIDMLCHFEPVDRQLDIHIALYAAPAERVGELLGRLGDHGIAIVIKPIDERPYWRVFLVL